MKNFAVTGGAGFIGSHLSKHLSELGHSVTIIDNFYKKDKRFFFGPLFDEIEFKKIDIQDYKNLEKSLSNVDGIFHQAGLISVSDSFSHENDYHNVNVTGTENILKISKTYDLKVVFASSAAVYGEPETIPILEKSPKLPTNPYGQTKLEAELVAQRYAETGVKIIGLRYFNVYGRTQSNQNSGVIEQFIDKIRCGEPPIVYGDGSQIRDFIHVNDIIKANLKAMFSKIDFGIFNVGSGNSISIKSLLELINKTFDISTPIIPIFKPEKKYDVKYSEASIDLIKKYLDWKPRISLRDWLLSNQIKNKNECW